ncbi:MAG TPA: HAD family hydrolase [Candidatus Hypogeohydataceae bacterium YC41]
MHNVVALVYDFDGTLTPQPMQEYTILPEIGIKKGDKFWEEVRKEAVATGGEEIVTYMRLMLEKSKAKRFPVRQKKLKSLAQNIGYFPGVESYFEHINGFVRNNFGKDIKLRHYIISAGLKEIISGTSIAKYFYKIFASEYYYDEYGAAVFPKVIVNDTLKTQFIFRINKGKESLHESINMHMPTPLRPIPFQNILYIGDGLTDVPCMTVIRKYEGYAIAVFKNRKGRNICKELLRAQRADFIARADYRDNSALVQLIKLLLNNIVEAIRYAKESFHQSRKYLT